jgi:HD-GYP domain-containing protein (c-di-GMP phosphodiesterase class II)
MTEPAARPGVRLAELLAVLSLAADLGMGQPMEHVLRQCLICLRLARCLGLGEADQQVVYYTALVAWVGCHVDAYEQAQRVRDSVEQTFERWDGKGVPKGAKGEEILVTSRLVALADVVEVFHRAGGTDAAVAVARQRRGTQFDPRVVDLFADQAPSLCAGLDEASTWDAVVGAEPGPGMRLTGAAFDAALEAIADFTDVKSPYTLGHSRGVADLAGEAARIVGLDGPAATAVRRAGLVHDLGRLGVPNTVWDKPGGLSHAETERVRLHPYLTERVLTCSPALAPLAVIAAQHHERLDGSGYPRGLAGGAVSAEGRVLAAADFYRARTESRPHRPAATAGEAAAQVRAEVRAGRLDGGAADAVLAAAGHRAARRPARPAGLTGREIEVLRLLARGLSNKQIAERLVISRKTASHHVEHIYAKTGTTNRALASLFAASNGLLQDAVPGAAEDSRGGQAAPGQAPPGQG